MQANHIKTFAGDPRLYRKITILGPVAMNLYLYLGMVGVVYGIHGETWIFNWQPILATVLFRLSCAHQFSLDHEPRCEIRHWVGLGVAGQAY